MADAPITFELVTTMRFGMGSRLAVGPTPLGVRAVTSVADGGIAEGPAITGDIVGPSADWVRRDADGVAHIDARVQVSTTDGANVFIHYTGVLELNGAVLAAMGSPTAETSFDDQYYRTAVRMECGDERYAWVNRTLFIGRGRFSPDGVVYEIYRC